MGSQLKMVQLWGGAARTSLPDRMIDASDIRPVPDNQEADFRLGMAKPGEGARGTALQVYTDPSSGQAVVLEIVEPLNPPPGEYTAGFCFRDLADVSGARVKELNTETWDSSAVPALTDVESVKTASGIHTVPERGSQAEHDVHVQMAVIRLQGSNGDIIVTLSTPQAGNAARVPPAPDNEASKGTLDQQAQLFKTMCKTLQMDDRSLLA